MIAQTETLQTEIGAIVEPQHVQVATPAHHIDGVQPQVVVAPGTAEQAARVLRYANDAGLRVAVRGNGSKLDWGNPPLGIDLLISTHRLNQVLEHAWGDMTATVQAGCTVAQVQSTLAEHGQRIALDPLWPATATIGGVVATNDSGALRLRFGALRDLILGITIALPDGTLAKSGGKVVKNVAGYDLPKLMTGALGTLGLIVETTFRLYPVPSATTTVSVPTPSAAVANELLLKLLDSTLVPTGAQLHLRPTMESHVVVRFEGIQVAMETQLDQLGRMVDELGLQRPAEIEPTVWEQREALFERANDGLVCKISVQPAQLSAVAAAIQRLAGPLRLDWELVMQAVGVGLLRLNASNDQALIATLGILRPEITQLDGSLVVLRCSPEVKQRVDVWGASGDALPVMRRIKQQFDPRAILNPGRFVGGI